MVFQWFKDWWWFQKQARQSRRAKALCKKEKRHLPDYGWRADRKGRFIDGKICGRCYEWLGDDRSLSANQFANMLNNRVNRQTGNKTVKVSVDSKRKR